MPTAAYQHSLSSPGYLPDMAHGELPPQAWTGGANMELTRGALRTIDGFAEAYSITASILHAVNVYTTTSNFWVAATATQLIGTDGSTTQAITRVSASSTLIPYTHPATGTWSSSVFGNYLVINNGNDVPQSWALSFSAPAANLTGWPVTWTNARLVRAFRNYLVAMDITISGTRYPSLVAWSDAAPFAQLPTTWTPATTNDAGDNELNDTGGWIIDAAPLGGSLAIYKEDAIWAMSYVGGSGVMAFRKLFTGVGLLAIHCVQEFNGQHFFIGRGDVFVTDGINLRSIAAGRVREKLFADMNPTYYERTFTAVDRVRREIWICYPTTQAWPDKALVWNYETDMWYPPRDIPPSSYMAGGILDLAVAGTTFAASDGTSFDATTDPFDIRSYNPSETELLACVPALRKMYQVHNGSGTPDSETTVTTTVTTTSSVTTTTTLRSNYTAVNNSIERKLLPFVGQDVTGGAALWGPQMKTVRRVWLDATGTGTIRVLLGIHPNESTDPTWYGPYSINLSSQHFAWCLLRGRFFSIKFEADSDNAEWALTGYKLEYELSGGF